MFVRYVDLVRSLQEPVDPRGLLDQRDICSEGVERSSGRFREIGAVERIGVVEKLNAARKRRHDASIHDRRRCQARPFPGNDNNSVLRRIRVRASVI